MLRNVYWKELGLLMFVWVAFLAIQVVKVNNNLSSLQHILMVYMLLFYFYTNGLFIFLLADLHRDMLHRVLDFKFIAGNSHLVWELRQKLF